MFDVRTASTTFTADTSLAYETVDGPAREWADALLLDLVLERPRDRRAFIGRRGALAARIQATAAPRTTTTAPHMAGPST